MEGTSTLIALLFVVTIFSSFGGVKEQAASFQPPKKQDQPEFQLPREIDYNSKAAIESFILKYRKKEQAEEIATSIVKHAQTYQVDPKLVAALMSRESRFNPYALSSSGAQGLGQLLPSTAKSLGISNGFDIDQNTQGTTRYVRYLLDKFKGFDDQVQFALAGYLEGPNAVYRNKGYSIKTQAYVNDILAAYKKI